MNRPTIADVAKASNVSVSTVDRVLSGRHAVRKATAQKVLSAAESIGFYGTPLIRHRMGRDRPARTFGFLLQQRSRTFYRLLGEALTGATDTVDAVKARAVVEYRDDLSPDHTAERLLELGRESDAVAVSSADHPKVARAIDELHDRGVKVFAVISDLTAAHCAGYVGLDNWKVGGTAALFVSSMCQHPGKVGVYVGSHRFLCQDAAEMRFRSYFRERAPDFQLLDSVSTLEDPRIAYELTLELLRRTPDLVGLFVAGGGTTGVIRALREDEAGASRRPIVVGRELTPEARSGLVDGLVKVVISTPFELLAETLLDAMASATTNTGQGEAIQRVLPFEIYTAENV
jgi:LacI family transcriptional regulator